MQKKMIISYILIMLAGALLAGLLFFLRYQAQADENTEARLRLAARAVEAGLISYGDDDIKRMIDTLSEISHMRVTVVSGGGQVVADFENAAENHAGRPEIKGALEHGEATATRVSDTTSRFYRYYAYRTEVGGETVVIRIATALSPLSGVKTRAALAAVTVAVAVFLIFAWYLIVRNISNIGRLEQVRSEFVSNVTHELKTPLTSIKGFVDTLKQGAVRDEEVAERFLDIIDIEADRLSALITDILELSEIETIHSDTGISDYLLDDILDDAVKLITPAAAKHGVTLTVFKNPSASVVRVNFDRLKQLLLNLLDNAVKYSNAGGSVSLCCELTGRNVIFTVTDDGIGIGEEHIPRIFERFYRVDKGRSRARGGTGLGLSVVKHIVRLYDGEIDVKSVKGKGTTFTVSLPVAVTA